MKLKLITIIAIAMLGSASWVAAADFEVSPASGQLNGSCTNTISVYADATSQSSNSADMILRFDPTKVQIVDSDPDIPGVQIQTGNAYQAYVSNQVNNGTGEIRVTALSFVNYLASRKLYAVIDFQRINNSTSAAFNFDFDGAGATLDSNIADSNNSLDLLTSVVNGSFTFTTGNCSPDNSAPVVQFVSPQANANNVALNSNLTFTITDNQSGVDLSSLSFVINGVTYNAASSIVSYTGTATNYSFTINPSNDWLVNQLNLVIVLGEDLDGNSFASQLTFAGVGYGQPAPVTPTPAVGITPTPCSCVNVVNLPPVETILENTVFRDTIVERFITTTGVTGSSALVTGAALSLGLLPYLSIISAPGLLLNLFGFFVGNRSKKPWGIVVDSSTNQPIPFAVCRIYLAGSASFVAQTLSDPDGRYGFVLAPGNYRLEVAHDKYVKFDEDISIGQGETTYVYDVRLLPNELAGVGLVGKRAGAGTLLKAAWKIIQPTLYVVGLTLALVGTLINFNIINLLILAVYLAGAALVASRILSTKPRHAAVIDAKSGLRVPSAIIKVYTLNKWDVVDTQITNNNGLFDFWGEPGEYAILVTARGYQFPSAKQTDLPTVDYGQTKLLRAKLKRGGNSLSLYLDPSTGLADAKQFVRNPALPELPGNLPTPFN